MPTKQRGRTTETLTEFPKKYTSKQSISAAKNKDLLHLCKTGVIPSEYSDFYKSLPSSINISDKLADGSRSLVRRVIGSKVHWSEGSLVRRVNGPKGQWFEGSMAQKYLKKIRQKGACKLDLAVYMFQIL